MIFIDFTKNMCIRILMTRSITVDYFHTYYYALQHEIS